MFTLHCVQWNVWTFFPIGRATTTGTKATATLTQTTFIRNAPSIAGQYETVDTISRYTEWSKK